ncbi:MAG: type II CAAX endopeptidase family protein [Chthoniobacterales bacterium]
MAGGFLTAIAAVTNVLFLVGGMYVYLALVRQISVRTTPVLQEEERTFGLPEVFLGFGLSALFLLNAAAAFSHGEKTTMRTNELIANGLISIALLLFVAAFLKFRGFSVERLAGFVKLSVARAIATGVVLLLAAYPLVILADLVMQRALGSPSSRQNIVEIFNDSQTLEQRVLIIILAVAIAPLVEEFVFRFFLYGVIKRYLGRFAGVIISAALFAAVHGHIPSALPLFVLGSCLALAYEWSGSILVSMTMHAIFNSLTLVALAFPDLIQP